MDHSHDIRPFWLRLWGQRRPLALFGGAGLVLGLLLSFVLPRWYTAQTTLLPPSESESGFGLTSLLRGLAVPGITIPTQATPADVFMAVLESRRVNVAVIERFELKKSYKKKLMTDALKELSRHTRFKLTEAGTIEIEVEDRDPKRAAAIANHYVELLDRFNREVRMTKGRRLRQFLEARLDEARSELASAEDKLAAYESKHRTVAISAEASAAIEAAAKLYAQRAALQVRLGVIQQYSRGGSGEETQVRQEMNEIDRQLSALPATGLEQARLLREVKTLEQVSILLRAQYEEARMDEVRDVSTTEVLDPATPPERHTRPRRLVLMLTGLLVGLAVGGIDAVVGWRRRTSAPGVA